MCSAKHTDWLKVRSGGQGREKAPLPRRNAEQRLAQGASSGHRRQYLLREGVAAGIWQASGPVEARSGDRGGQSRDRPDPQGPLLLRFHSSTVSFSCSKESSNGCGASVSSSGSRKGSKKGWARACEAVRRLSTSNSRIFSSRSMAAATEEEAHTPGLGEPSGWARPQLAPIIPGPSTHPGGWHAGRAERNPSWGSVAGPGCRIWPGRQEQ